MKWLLLHVRVPVHVNWFLLLAVDLRFRASTDIDRLRSHIPRSRSAQSLKNAEQSGSEDKLTIVAQMFWIAVSLLESDYEYEFLLAVQLLGRVSVLIFKTNECYEIMVLRKLYIDSTSVNVFISVHFFDSKILQHIQPERTECRERLEKIQQQIKWTTFPGVQTLLLKVRQGHVLTLRCLMRVSW